MAMVVLLAAHPRAALTVVTAALIVIPVLAALAALRLSRRGGPALLVALVAGSVLWPERLAGQISTLALLVLSSVALGGVLSRLGGPRALAAGVAALAVADVALLSAGAVGAATNALEQVELGALPSFGEAVVGSVHMGYGDLLVAGVVGAIAARSPGGALRVGALTLILSLLEGVLLADAGPYPATVPVVVALGVEALWSMRRGDPVPA
jgi:hypothetical protein